jgi:AcrR family transcriptional regulator
MKKEVVNEDGGTVRASDSRRTGIARLSLLADSALGDTKSKILDAAFRRLAQDGYTALSVREIARDAGVNHALINYHFRTKDLLVIAVLDEANRQLLERQQRMYAEPGEMAQKWARARRFYADDLASGFVRVQAELWAASLSNPGLRASFLPRVQAWKQVVLEAVQDALATLEAGGVELPPPFTADVIATWISQFWLGMEFSDLIAEREERTAHRMALDAMQQVLEALDARVRGAQAAPDGSVRPKPGTARKRR